MKNIIKIVLLPQQRFNSFWNYMMFKLNRVIHTTYTINGRLEVRNSGGIIIGENFSANSGNLYNPIGGDIVLRLIAYKGGTIEIGQNVGISNSTIVCFNSIKIDDYVSIGGGCKIWDSDFHSINAKERCFLGDINAKTAPILIKKYAFIGGSSIILKGVTIGENSVIAAGSVVTRDIPDNEVWGGNPAKFIKKNNNFTLEK